MMRPLSLQSRQAVVLMAEDNEDHFFLVGESLREARLKIDLHRVESGDQCLAFLRRHPPYQNAPWPDLLLLDMHMPRMGGYEVMQAINADPALRALTVVVLSTSAESQEVSRMYELGCKSYIAKPVDFRQFTDAVSKLAGYWFELVVLPGRE